MTLKKIQHTPLDQSPRPCPCVRGRLPLALGSKTPGTVAKLLDAYPWDSLGPRDARSNRSTALPLFSGCSEKCPLEVVPFKAGLRRYSYNGNMKECEHVNCVCCVGAGGTSTFLFFFTCLHKSV